MSIFKKSSSSPAKIPDGFSQDDIKVESGICTGEKTIGFYDKQSKHLCFAELISSEKDIENYYKKYGLKRR